MRRRAAEYRRPVRRRFSYWIWALFGVFSVASLVLLVVNHNQHEDRVEQPVLGLLSQEKLDSFNLPMYCPSVDEVEKLVQENGCFDILILETQPQRPIVLRTSQECRAGLESILRKHLGSEIVEPLFHRYSTKLAGRSPIIPQDHGLHVGLLVLLKRKIAG